MRNGYLCKLLDNIERLVQSGADVQPLIDKAKSQAEGGHDANPDEWDELNQAVDNLPDDSSTNSSSASAAGTRVEQGTAGNQQYVSGKEPGELGNPIGYPGTNQDQEEPGKRPSTVPGQKLTKE